MIEVNGTKVTPTIFPDKTSQVWKMDSTKFLNESIVVKWNFESEDEVMHVLQLVTLIRGLHGEDTQIALSLPYLPYARQDKEVSNETTFALHTFLGLMAMAFDAIEVFDPHSTDLLYKYFGDMVNVIQPEKQIRDTINYCKSDMICYPDEGAAKRYPFLSDMKSVCLTKTRNQLTGEITGMEVLSGHKPDGLKVLIVDDLCDGGRTFREAAKVLLAEGAELVDLYVSHGIFSHPMGAIPLYNDGIETIYTKEGRYLL